MKVIFTCGGTAGHVNPALALAGYMREKDAGTQILFVGAERGLERDLIAHTDYPFRTVNISSFHRSFRPAEIKHNLVSLKNLAHAEREANAILHDFHPDIIVGTGGYASYPLVRYGAKAGIPTAVHESNIVPGLTTRQLELHCDRIMVGFEDCRAHYKHPEKVVVTGTPVRGDFFTISKQQAKERLGMNDGRKLIVSFWGSLGSNAMNRAMAEFLALESAKEPFYHIHGVGEICWKPMQQWMHDDGLEITEHPALDVREYIYDMATVMRAATAEGIKLYLASGLIKGIGKSIAARIVKAFGEDTLRIFDEEPQRLLEISGITQKKLVTIVECWTEHQGVRNLVQFLQPHDIGASFAVRIYKHYGPQALSIVQENPYRLAMDIRGIGFLTADALAAKLGFESEHPLRIQAGTLYTLMKQIDDGHVYYPRRALVEQTCSQLGIAEEFVEEAVDCLAREERVVLEELDDEIGVYLTRFHHYESKIAYYLRRILASPKSVRVPKADEVVEKVVSRLGITLAEEQLEAVRTSATSKVMVLTGGPGTGKTTILNAIIQVFAENKAKILLAAIC